MNRRTMAEMVAVVAALLLVFVIVGTLNPLQRNLVDTDRLGPESGENIADYRTRAANTLAPGVGADVPRWALVSFGGEVTAEAAFRSVGSSRIAQVLFRVPIDRVQTPVLTEDVPGDEASVVSAASYAASRLSRGGVAQSAVFDSAADPERESRIDVVTVTRLNAGCACVVAVTVRASVSDLRSTSQQSGVRSVEALPSGAEAGHFAVTPLLPEQTDTASPLPDDGVVPDN